MNAAVYRGSRGPQCVGPAAGACVFCVVEIFCPSPSQVLLWRRHNKTWPHLVFAVDASHLCPLDLLNKKLSG